MPGFKINSLHKLVRLYIIYSAHRLNLTESFCIKQQNISIRVKYRVRWNIVREYWICTVTKHCMIASRTGGFYAHSFRFYSTNITLQLENVILFYRHIFTTWKFKKFCSRNRSLRLSVMQIIEDQLWLQVSTLNSIIINFQDDKWRIIYDLHKFDVTN